MPCLHNIRKVGVACTYGGTRLRTFLAGDPCRRFITRSLRYSCAPGTRCDYVALHDMNHTRADRREKVPGASRATLRALVRRRRLRARLVLANVGRVSSFVARNRPAQFDQEAPGVGFRGLFA